MFHRANRCKLLLRRYFSTLCGIHCSLNLLISYTDVTAWCRRYLACWRKLQNLHAARSLKKSAMHCIIMLNKNVKLCKHPGPVACVLCIPRLLAILHQTHQDICWGDDEALPMNQQFQRSKPRNRCLSEWVTPRHFSWKWLVAVANESILGPWILKHTRLLQIAQILQKQLSARYVLITLDINFLDNEGDSQESKKFPLNYDTPK